MRELLSRLLCIIASLAGGWCYHGGAVLATDTERPALDRRLTPIDFSDPQQAARLSETVAKLFPAGNPSASRPWLSILRREGEDRPMTPEERASFARERLPAVGLDIGGRKVDELKAINDGAYLSFAPTAHFRIGFETGPDLWLQTFASEERGLVWASGVILSQALAGNPRPIGGTVVTWDEQQFVCLDDGEAAGQVMVCATKLFDSRTILSIAERPARSDGTTAEEARGDMVRRLAAAANDIRWLIGQFRAAEASSAGGSAGEGGKAASESSKAQSATASWQNDIRQWLPGQGYEGKVAALTLDERAVKLEGYRGAARLRLVDGREYQAYLFAANRDYRGKGALLASDLRTAGDAEAKDNSVFSLSYGLAAGLPVACHWDGRSKQKQVAVTCGLADPELPLILAITSSFGDQQRDQMPKPVFERLAGELVELRDLVMFWLTE
jgi:hypothetical protein